MYSFGFMTSSKYKKQSNHNIPLLEVPNINDSAIERRTLYPKRAAVLILSCMRWTSHNWQSSLTTNSSKAELLFQLLQNNNHQALGKNAESGDTNIAHSITCSKTVTDGKKLSTKGATLRNLPSHTKDTSCPIQ